MKTAILSAMLTICMIFSFAATITGHMAFDCLAAVPMSLQVVAMVVIWVGVLSLNILMLGWLFSADMLDREE